jgi:hypothetical protein
MSIGDTIDRGVGGVTSQLPETAAGRKAAPPHCAAPLHDE